MQSSKYSLKVMISEQLSHSEVFLNKATVTGAVFKEHERTGRNCPGLGRCGCNTASLLRLAPNSVKFTVVCGCSLRCRTGFKLPCMLLAVFLSFIYTCLCITLVQEKLQMNNYTITVPFKYSSFRRVPMKRGLFH